MDRYIMSQFKRRDKAMKGKKYHVRITEEEKKRLLDITKKENHLVRQIIRANTLLQFG